MIAVNIMLLDDNSLAVEVGQAHVFTDVVQLFLGILSPDESGLRKLEDLY
jgi:hypothetical protein